MGQYKPIKGYKTKIRALSFEEKVLEYFNLDPTKDDLTAARQKIIYSTMGKKEQKIFDERYRPISRTIEKYSERVRNLQVHCNYFGYYITSIFRERDQIEFSVKWINRALDIMRERGLRVEDISQLQSYRSLHPWSSKAFYNEETGYYELDESPMKSTVAPFISDLKELLSSFKSYVESMKEFLKDIGEPQLYPNEFKEMEQKLMSSFNPLIGFRYRAYHSIPEKRELSRDEREERAFLDSLSQEERDFLFIIYSEIPTREDLMGEENLWGDYYNQITTYNHYGRV